MKNIKSICAALGLAVFATNGVATEFGRNAVVLDKILPISATRVINPPSRNIVRIYVNEGAWGGSTCRGNSADISGSDKALMAVLLTAWTLGKGIDVVVDDSLRPIDSVCQVVSIAMSK